MTLHFYLQFSTHFGQTIFVSGNIEALGNDNLEKAFPLSYLNNKLWHGSIVLNDADTLIRYKYILRDINTEETVEFGEDRLINTNVFKVPDIVAIDTWNHPGQVENAFYTQPFQNVLLNDGAPAVARQRKREKAYTHLFKVKAPLLRTDEIICILGSATILNEWQTTAPVPLTKDAGWWSVKVNLSKEVFPVTYKYAVYNNRIKQFVQYEAGDNRTVPGDAAAKKVTILHDGFAALPNDTWRGAGVAIPVFSLRTKNGFGTGEFADIRLLVDWARQSGIKLIQLLPLNDTTATHTWKDSYPYAAISAFALHPLFLNLEKLAADNSNAIIKALQKKKRQLNALPDLDYEQVMKFKLLAINELYHKQKDDFKNDIKYFEFFDVNRHWLVPYAAFCYLRDKYKTADFSKWRSNSTYDETAIQRLVSSSQKHYDDIAIHYYIQYHLHLQLKEVTSYAHKNGIIVKGDIPIGICRNSVDAWMEPALYDLQEQAGAPPDDFAVKGQNWGFPTYNWKKMQEDHFTWWRQRFEQMSNYFDAFRIDHILGFFRIWSIPLHEVEGVMGRFVPAIPVHINEFSEQNIYFNKYRYCKPHVTDHLLYRLFGDDKNEIQQKYFDGYQLKPQFDTQRKVETYFEGREDADKIKYGLFDIISNVILLEEEHSDGQKFHFRIAMEQTSSFTDLDAHTQYQLKELYINYFFRRQDEFWKKEAMHKLPGLKRSTNMLICGEDLGMVPHCVPEVMEQLGILSLEIQRMPKKAGAEFFHPANAPYLSVVTPSTHDMSTIRGWWEEDKEKTQRFYNRLLGHYGEAPFYCEAGINKEIIVQHLQSPAMWSIFQLQDLLGMDETLRRTVPGDERINIPADPNHYWRYRIHIGIEDLLKAKDFNDEVRAEIEDSGR